MIYLLGYFGCGNCGDDLILMSFLNKRSNKKITIPLGNAYKIKTIVKTLHATSLQSLRIIPRKNLLLNLYYIIRSKYIIAPGGSLFQTKTSTLSFYYYYTLTKVALFFNKKVSFHSQGIGPFKKEKTLKKLIKLIKKCTTFTVRDIQSQKLLRKYGTKTTIEKDPIHTFPLPKVRLIPNDKGVLGKKTGEYLLVFPYRTVTKSEQKMLHNTKKYSVKIFQMNKNWDGNIQKVIDLIGNAKQIISYRYHPALLSKRLKKPVVMIGSDPKLTALSKELRIPLYTSLSQNIPYLQ
ncbi:polysaccharide pyruvyl transferase family protein [Candidatus Margulisiibacteriota bacterium]